MAEQNKPGREGEVQTEKTKMALRRIERNLENKNKCTILEEKRISFEGVCPTGCSAIFR